MSDFLREHSSALFGFLGALCVAVFSLVSNWLLKKREFNLATWDKIVDRRIRAHENLIMISAELSVMCPLPGVDSNGGMRRTPQVLTSKATLDDWITRYAKVRLEGSPWVTTKATREAYYLQDYMVFLHKFLSESGTTPPQELGACIFDDFIDNAASLNDAALGYFYRELWDLKLAKQGEWHKHPKPETVDRIEGTRLWAAVAEINAQPSSS